MYLLGYDVGSSSIKATLLDANSGRVVASATSPSTEMEIIAVNPGWAEQHPSVWWDNVRSATAELLQSSGVRPESIVAIGISYQMHGLVTIDSDRKVLRPAIIWCDSRAVEIGEHAFREIGEETCLQHFLNSPGNFTASKLKWIKDYEPSIYRRIDKFMLPGDYIAMMMTDEIVTTPSGLSEGILWDFPDNGIAGRVLEYYGIDPGKVPRVVPTFSEQGRLTKSAAAQLGLLLGTPVSYRAGDQPNNALSLNVLNPGEVATTAGTSGVVYGVTDTPAYDPRSRVNPFVHVTHTDETPRYGVLMCINGTGILNSWLRHHVVSEGVDYAKMNDLAAEVPPGSDGVRILPYGNGAERTLDNRNIGASIHGLTFNTHDRRHLLRAAQEGIVFAFRYGLDIMGDMGVTARTVRAGNANMFLSPLFRETVAAVTGASVELYNTDGSQGAARGAGIGAGIYQSLRDAFAGLETIDIIEPSAVIKEMYAEIYEEWRQCLDRSL